MSECGKNVNRFCVMCGRFVSHGKARNFTKDLRTSFCDIFGIEELTLDNPWVPKVICPSCLIRVRLVAKGDRSKLFFYSPMIWRQPFNHPEDCYFCKNYKFGANSKTTIAYIETTSVSFPVLLQDVNQNLLNDENDNHIPEIDNNPQNITEPMEVDDLGENENGSENYSDSEQDESMVDDGRNRIKGQLSQKDLNDLIRELDLPKDKSELLASRLQEFGCLQKETRICVYRDRDLPFSAHFEKDSKMVFCNDIPGLMEEFGKYTYKPEDWRLFIDSSKRSLKAVLLNKGNILACIPIAHSTVMNESYENMSYLLDKIKYKEHNWKICTDLKVVTILLGQQSGYTKMPCFLCKWDSRARNLHYIKKDWPPRQRFVPGESNVINANLVDPAKVILPPLHIKLGLMKQYIKALKKRDSPAFHFLAKKFPKLTEAKIKEGIFDGPQIRTLMKDNDFPKKMSQPEKKAWDSFVDVCRKLLGNYKDPDHENIARNMVENFKDIDCLMSLKLHFMDNHRDKFPTNLGDESEEQGERFHQDIKEMERRWQGLWSERMLGDYCWMLKRETSLKHRRKSLARSFEDRCRPKKLKEVEYL